MQRYLILAVLTVLFISVFAAQNAQPVTLRIIIWDLPPVPLVMVILFSVSMGVLVTLLFSVTRQFRLNMQIRELQGRIKKLEKESAPHEKESSRQ